MSRRSGTFGRIHRLRAEVHQLIEALLEEPVASVHGWEPPVDLVEHPTHFEVRIEVPGVRAADLQLELTDQLLVVRGDKRHLPAEPPPRHYHLMERFSGAFEVTVELPRSVLPTAATARLGQGVLAVHLPKVEDKRHRRYLISVQEDDDE